MLNTEEREAEREAAREREGRSASTALAQQDGRRLPMSLLSRKKKETKNNFPLVSATHADRGAFPQFVTTTAQCSVLTHQRASAHPVFNARRYSA